MVKIYRAAIVGRLDHDDVVLETDHLAEIAAWREKVASLQREHALEIIDKLKRIEELTDGYKMSEAENIRFEIDLDVSEAKIKELEKKLIGNLREEPKNDTNTRQIG